MQKTSSIFILMLLVLSISVSALTVNLKGPINNAEIDAYKVEFIYGFDAVPDVKSCSLMLNGENKATRATLINYDNNKITSELEQGSYEWYIRCVDQADNIIDSQIRKFTINVEVNNSAGYETIYNNNGLRTYVISITEGQAPVGLPVMKSGENMIIKNSKTKHYIDLLKMGVQNGVNFIEVRDRTNAKISKILVGESLDFDFEKDGIVDINLILDKVTRGVDASIVVNPYPASFESEETPAEEEAPVKETTETPVEQPIDEPVKTETPTETVKPTEETKTPVETQKSSSGKVFLILAMIVVLAIIAYFALKGKPTLKANSPKINSEKKETEKPKNEEPLKEQNKENFEVIKSTSAKKKRN